MDYRQIIKRDNDSHQIEASLLPEGVDHSCARFHELNLNLINL